MRCFPPQLPNRVGLRAHGFTLIEILVALAIVALALGAGARATGALTRNAERQTSILLAQLCAENALVAVRLARQMPSVGDQDKTCNQADRTLDVHLSVRPTPNPNFVRVQAEVSDAGVHMLGLSTVVGRF